MADRPPRDVDWIPDNATGISVPGTVKQDAGWLVEKPARQFFNWLWNRASRWFHYLSGQSQEYIVIDSVNDNEKDYDTLAAYIADAPAAGDKVLVKETQALTAQMIIPDSITLRMLDGINFTRATNEANSVIKFGSDIVIEGVLNLVLSQTGATAKAIEFDGDNVIGNIDVENSSTGTLTTVHHININKAGNRVDGFIQNTGGGTLTNVVVDDSTEDSNYFIIRDDINKSIGRSRGSNTFIPSSWPSFRVDKGTADQGVNTVNPTKVTWPNEDFDTNANFAADKFTPQAAGKYLLLAKVFISLCDGGDFSLLLYKNGALVAQITDFSGGASRQIQIEDIFDANGTTDFFEVYIDSATDNSYTVAGNINVTSFSGTRIA